ncbi:DsbA family protein [Nocardia sp. NPDC019304]|uniref:mycothiol-dependent nitroreductase Rv2466c family protein n=1 Tax=unclassified Nocardia TaxID=2637762 RepID=UPI0033C62CA3
MADIDLYLDPVCPFSWVSARWLLETAGEDHQVTLRQMNLAVLNEGTEVDEKQRPMLERSRRLGRLCAAVTDRHGRDAFARLYAALGSRMHVGGAHDDAVIAAAITESGLDPTLVETLDDASLDRLVSATHHDSQQVLGATNGAPIIVVDGHAFAGPVLTGPPAPDRARALLEALVTLTTTAEFADLHRPYQGPPTIAGRQK